MNATPDITHLDVDAEFKSYMDMAADRIFSLAAGNRIGVLAPEIMKVGFAKILLAAEKLGFDIEQNKSFVNFLPDGTCSYNIERTRRGFSYGALLNLDFGSMIATSNSMTNGCGLSIFELEHPIADDKAQEYVRAVQKRIGQDTLSELSRGNHFSGWYKVIDPVTGEDTNRRFVVVHCSGHVGVDKMYFPETWLTEIEGYNRVSTPHGDVTFLEGEAKELYLKQFIATDRANADNRIKTMDEIFPEVNWRTLENVTHQGLLENGKQHVIGAQRHDSMVPVAMNPEEGLITLDIKQNVRRKYHKLLGWEKAEELGLQKGLENVSVAPHGGGYEFRQELSSVKINLDKMGIRNFEVNFSSGVGLSFEHFKQIREHMTFRRKNSIMREIYRADLGDLVFELPYVVQIYPAESVPGGT